MQFNKAFSIFEVLICLLIVSILAIFIVKPQIQEIIAIRQASLHIQMLQKDINQIVYNEFLQKNMIDEQRIFALLQNKQVQNQFFSFHIQRQNFVLRIGQKRLQMQIKKSPSNHYVISCNPSQLLCRKLYHRKHVK